jgi:putative tryptophan/tyrosine transport system substrate-binding protein
MSTGRAPLRRPANGPEASRLLIVLAGLLLAACPALGADVAVLKSSDVATWRPALDALQRVAAGHTLTEYDLRGDRTLGESVVRGLKGRAAVLVALGPLAAQLAREQLPETPLVFCMVQDPAQSGIAVGPNVTGVSFNTPLRNQLAAFRIVYPSAFRVGVLYNEANTGRLVQDAEKVAPVVQMTLVPKTVNTEKDIPATLRTLLGKPEPVDALWLIPDPMLLSEESRRYILSETLNAGRPLFSFSAALVAEGALVSSGPDFTSIGEKAGELVNRMIAGERRIDMLVPRAELVINTKIAAKLKIRIPPEVLKAARTF